MTDLDISSPIQLIQPIQKPLIRLSSYEYNSVVSFISRCASSISRPQKIVVVSVGLGFALVGLAARYFRRRRHPQRKSALSRPNDGSRHRKSKPLTIRSPSGEIYSVGGNVSPGFHRSYRHSSISAGSDRASVASVLTTQGDSTLSPQQYGLMGLPQH